MKANRGPRTPLVIVAVAMAALTVSCNAPRVVPTPAPRPTVPSTAATTTPVPPRPRTDWRDVAITPGDWRWGIEGGQSIARFADGLLVLRCDPAGQTVVLERMGTGQRSGQVPVTLVTTYGMRQLSATARTGSPVLSISFAARDPLLDSIAFSRGRFALETAGLPTLYVPSWPEIGKVIGDCR